MICPVCKGIIDDDAKFCSSCGARMSSFANVDPSKIIVSQTPAEQMELGDDTDTYLIPDNYEEAEGDDEVTQLIPENYMEAEGDDEVTQLIPENYMTAKGDDSATMLLDPLDGKTSVAAPSGFKLANQTPPTYGQMPYQQNVEPKQNNMLPIFVIGGLVLLGVIALAILFG